MLDCSGLAKLKTEMASKPTAHVTVVLATDEAKVLQRLNVTEELADTFRNTVYSALTDRFSSSTAVPYEPGYKLDQHEVAVMALKETVISEVVASVSDVGPMQLFAAERKVIDRLRFYSVVVDFGQDRKAVFFRTCNSKLELSRRAGFAAFFNKGQYNCIKESIFVFDEAVDCLAWDGHLYIASMYNFNRLFGYFEELRKEVDAILAKVVNLIPISNDKAFREACRGQLQMVSKLNQIAQKPYFGSITMDDIRTINHCNLDVEIIEEDGVKKLVFEPSPQKRWLILKLLDDDFLESTMTGNKYAAYTGPNRPLITMHADH